MDIYAKRFISTSNLNFIRFYIISLSNNPLSSAIIISFLSRRPGGCLFYYYHTSFVFRPSLPYSSSNPLREFCCNIPTTSYYLNLCQCPWEFPDITIISPNDSKDSRPFLPCTPRVPIRCSSGSEHGIHRWKQLRVPRALGNHVQGVCNQGYHWARKYLRWYYSEPTRTWLGPESVFGTKSERTYLQKTSGRENTQRNTRI